MTETIRRRLLSNGDDRYGSFQSGLIPGLAPGEMIGVRTPLLRKLAKELVRRKETEAFLRDLPHRYHEENVLHGFIVAEEKDFSRCMEETERFLPYVTNWAVCDGFSPKVFARHQGEVLERCRVWLQSEQTYTVRFALVMLLKHCLTESYAEEALALAAQAHGEYYVNMAAAWLFAEAMAKCPKQALPYLQQGVLSHEVHNKAIQKAVESYRVTSEMKAYLKTLKRKRS